MDPTTGHQYQKPNIKGVTKAVLVTGGAGYVGSHTCKLLAKNGYVPITIDRHFREGLKTFGPCHDLHLPQDRSLKQSLLHHESTVSIGSLNSSITS